MVGATQPQKLSGRYDLNDRIATGGMGAVYVGTDERLSRRVAVKLLKEELAEDPRFVERFRREARAVGALSHPNIAAVFDFGEDSGRHYMVMELVDGDDLARVLREEGRLAPERTAEVGAQIAEALHHAHQAGVVHRDVKPANVIVGAGDRVKVTDFGIARAVGDSTLTAIGSVLGTAHYISPEQASGKDITGSSDIYSLGIVLYEMLTGSLPFTGDSALAVAMRHVSDPVPPPSELNPDVPGRLDSIVAKATAKDPSQRYRNASEMAADLRGEGHGTTAVLGGAAAVPATEVISSEPTQTVWPIPGDRWDPHKIGRGALALFLVLVVVAAGLLLWRVTSGDDEPNQAPAAGTQPEETNADTASEAPVEEPGTITLDDYAGTSKKDAEKELKELGLEPSSVDVFPEEYGLSPDEFPKDTVIATDPGAGTDVEEGAPITLLVSNGEFLEGEEGDGDEDGPPEEPPGQEKKDKED